MPIESNILVFGFNFIAPLFIKEMCVLRTPGMFASIISRDPFVKVLFVFVAGRKLIGYQLAHFGRFPIKCRGCIYLEKASVLTRDSLWKGQAVSL